MASTVERIRAKVTRAKQHIEDFQLRAIAFDKTQPCVIGVKEDTEAGQRVYYVMSIEDVPENLAAIAANAVHDLRTPLDYIATQIETAACGAKPKHRVYFPIGRDATHYETLRRAYIRCAPQAAVDAFDATEPYKGGKGHALWQLHNLNKPDKHEIPLATAAGYGGVDVGGDFRTWLRKSLGVTGDVIPDIWIKPADRMCPLKAGDELFLEPMDREVDEDRKFQLQVSFHQPGVIECEPVLPTLHQFADLVSGIVTRFEPLLPP